MFIDHPRDHSAVHLLEMNGRASNKNLEKAKGDIFDERTGIITEIETKLNQLVIEKAGLRISISGKCGTPLKVSVKSPDNSFVTLSECNLSNSGTEPLNESLILGKLKAINDTEYFIEQLELDHLSPNVFLPFKELTSIKKRILFILNDSKKFIDPVDVPVLRKHTHTIQKPTLSVILSSKKDLFLCKETVATIHFRLPNCLRNDVSELITLFKIHGELIPWFPSIIIGEDFRAAKEFLQQVQPKYIITDNTGIAYEAFKKGIRWIAGPSLNIVNSFSLLCLKETFHCSGAFISNELSKIQLKAIKKPSDFEIYYSICHPIVLMTSRQCLFHQVTGCSKNTMEDSCIQNCEKSAIITNLKQEKFIIEKSRENYHRIFNETHCLNTDVVSEVPDLFSGFFIDLSDVKTETKMETDKLSVIKLFEYLIQGIPDSKKILNDMIYPSTNIQYEKGI